MEELYHYLWKNRMMGRTLRLSSGDSVEIIDPGLYNRDSGPDFFNAKIKIGEQMWAGNVEIHVKASDWHRHGHDSDPAYDDVILHAVAIDDTIINRKNGSRIPQVVITMPEQFFRTLSSLENDMESVRCASRLGSLTGLQRADWVESLGIERLQQKASRIKELLDLSGGDWETACFITLARSLGFGLNAQPFEMLARSLSLNYLSRHSDSLVQTEAILFGQAGMLDSSIHIFDEYYQLLCREYYFLARKYGLRPMRRDLWKYARTRPANFPHRRIAILAKALEGGFRLLSALLDTKVDRDGIVKLFSWKLEGYWLSHSDFDVETGIMPAILGQSSMDLLIINFAVPLLYAYYNLHGEPDNAEKVCNLLCDTRAESNSYINHWKTLGFECKDAFHSQALLHLRKEYCDRRKCLDCRFGHLFLRRDASL